MNTSDFSSNQWVTCFQDTGAEILGCSAQELGELREQNSPEYDSVFQKANFKDFIFRVRAKMDTYNVSYIVLHTIRSNVARILWHMYIVVPRLYNMPLVVLVFLAFTM